MDIAEKWISNGYWPGDVKLQWKHLGMFPSKNKYVRNRKSAKIRKPLKSGRA